MITEWKWTWVGHIVLVSNESWNRRLLEWHPRAHTRPRSKPPMRWKDDIKGRASQDLYRLRYYEDKVVQYTRIEINIFSIYTSTLIL